MPHLVRLDHALDGRTSQHNDGKAWVKLPDSLQNFKACLFVLAKLEVE